MFYIIFLLFRDLLEKISVLESDLHKLQADLAASKCNEMQKVNEEHYRSVITTKKHTNVRAYGPI